MLIMKWLAVSALVLSVMTFAPRDAAAQIGSIDGFGSLRVAELSSSPDSYGAKLALKVFPGFEVIGEAGRISNVLPDVTTALIDLVPVGGVRVGAFYGEGGIRLSPAPRAPVHPYLEASAGVARLDVRVAGLGPTADALTRAALGFLARTEPIAGVGGGVIIQGGPLLVDLGYRYKQILADNVFSNVLGAGDSLHAHQVRVGVGVRF
jgi:hypothetical protein